MLKYAAPFDAAAATATVSLSQTDLGPVLAAGAGRLLLEINGGSTPNWALSIQGKFHPSGTWHNLDYSRIDNGAVQTQANAQLTVNWSTAQYYVVTQPPPFIQLVGTRTGGTLTVYAYATDAGNTHA